MKKYALEFVRRGTAACGLGPLVLAVVYLILQRNEGVQMLSVDEVCIGIFSLTALAFVAGGMNVVYQIEQLPLMPAILMHGIVLYISYLVVYLVNGWLRSGIRPILFFSVIFALGYLVIWVIIYFLTKRNTEKINESLKKKQSTENQG